MSQFNFFELMPEIGHWSTTHPDWNPEQNKAGDGWPQLVNSYLYEPSPDPKSPLIILDPLLPPERTQECQSLWVKLDAKARWRPVVIILLNQWHHRSAQRIFDRYAEQPQSVALWAHEAAIPHLSKNACQVTHSFKGATILPGGIEAVEVQGLWPGEVALYLHGMRTLMVADALLGDDEGSGLRMPPARWGQDPEKTHEGLRNSLKIFLNRRLRHVLVSHGESIFNTGREALKDALDLQE